MEVKKRPLYIAEYKDENGKSYDNKFVIYDETDSNAILKAAIKHCNLDEKIYVETKFILIPEVNTNKEEIDKWLEKTVEVGIKTIVVDIENDFCRDLRAKNLPSPQYLVDLSSYIIQRAKELDLLLIDYNNFRYLTTEHNLM